MKLTAAHLTRFKTALAHGVVALLFGLGTGQALATPLNISDKPLDTLEGVPANILLTMDDSGSMRRSYMPGDIEFDDNTRRAKSSTFNKVYYNPAITYLPAEDEFGASLGNATFTAAWLDGFDRTTTDDLSTGYCAWWSRDTDCARNSDLDDTNVAAFYYVFDPSNTNGGGGSCDASGGSRSVF